MRVVLVYTHPVVVSVASDSVASGHLTGDNSSVSSVNLSNITRRLFSVTRNQLINP